MNKLKLDLEKLEVESFDLGKDARRGRGTVEGQEWDDQVAAFTNESICYRATCWTCTCPDMTCGIECRPIILIPDA